MPIGLTEILAPVPPPTFLTDHWPGKPLFVRGAPDKLRDLRALPPLTDVSSMVATRTASVRTYLPDFNDESRSELIPPTMALAAYRADRTLIFDALEDDCPSLAPILNRLARELELPGTIGEISLTHARAIGYATPAGGRTGLHFDANANFVVQLQGRKRWSLATNRSVTNPTDRYAAGSGEIGVALDKQCHAPLIDELPDDTVEHVLQPGDVLFVPRGYWHETSTDEDSLSLTFAFTQPTWADLVLATLRDRLLQSPDWRALARGNPPEFVKTWLERESNG